MRASLQRRSSSNRRCAWNRLEVSSSTTPSSVASAATFENADRKPSLGASSSKATSALPGCTWVPSSSPRQARSARSRTAPMLGGDAQVEPRPAADQVGVEEFPLGAHAREARQLRHQRLERGLRLEPCQGGAEAEVRAEAEGDVAARVAPDVEAIGIREAALVAVRRAEQRHHRRLRRDALAVE